MTSIRHWELSPAEMTVHTSVPLLCPVQARRRGQAAGGLRPWTSQAVMPTCPPGMLLGPLCLDLKD